MTEYSIIIPYYDSIEYLEETLKSIRKTLADRTYEIVLVNNASNDLVARHNVILGIDNVINLNKNYGFAVAVNIGLRAATGKYKIVINSDVIFAEQDWAKKLVDKVKPGVGLVGPSKAMRNNDYGQAVSLWCTLFTDEALEKVGYLDERFFIYFEDDDYGLRLRNAGLSIQSVNMEVNHLQSKTEFDNPSKIFKESHQKFIDKWDLDVVL